jgi:hypothetical protein
MNTMTTSIDSAPPSTRRDGRATGYFTLAGYVLVTVLIAAAWSVSNQNLIRAESGLGYWLGITGTTLMGLLLLYPLRKRVRAMRGLGPTSLWFRVHMIFGIVGPLLIILHSNFRLGSMNGRIALFCTLIVAASGIVGRYIYAKLHYGLYGRRASIEGLRRDVETLRESKGAGLNLLPAISGDLAAREDRLLSAEPGILGAFVRAMTIAPETVYLRWLLQRRAKRHINRLAESSQVIATHRKRIQRSANLYLSRRLSAVRKYAQFQAFESLFSLWHIVHYPLFLILVVAVIVHVIAVHMY